MSEMVKRAARVVKDVLRANCVVHLTSREPLSLDQVYERVARKVLAELGEPTAAMMVAGVLADEEGGRYNVEQIWAAMHAAAMNDGATDPTRRVSARQEAAWFARS